MTRWDDIIRAWSQVLGQYQSLGKGIAIACSGGMDSTVLAHTLLRAMDNSRFAGPRLLVHVNYRLRGAESDLDQALVEQVAHDFLIPCQVHCVSQTDQEMRKGKSLQEWARDIRLEVFQELIAKNFVVALGHNRNDLCENALLRAARGCSLGTLAGMQEFKGEHAYWRPLLNIGREEIAEYARNLGVMHREDATNAKIIYSRNLVRHQLISKLQDVNTHAVEHIAQLANDAFEMTQYCRDLLLSEVGHFADPWIKVETILTKPRTIAYELMSLMIENASGPKKPQISRELLHMIHSKLSASTGKKEWCFNIADGLIFTLKSGMVAVVPEKNLQKKIRFLQHQNSLRSHDEVPVLLRSGARLRTRRGGETRELVHSVPDSAWQSLKF